MPLFSDVDVSNTGASQSDNTKSNYLEDLLLVKKDKLNNDQNSNKRMIAFNESYRKKQGDYLWLLLYVFIALIIFVFFYTMRMFFPFIPDIVMDLLYINLFAFLLLFIAIKIYYIQKRSNMNYDELDIPSNIPKPNDTNNNVPRQDINLYGELTSDMLATQVVNSIFDFHGGIYTCSYKNNRYFITYTYTDNWTDSDRTGAVATIKKKKGYIYINYICIRTDHVWGAENVRIEDTAVQVCIFESRIATTAPEKRTGNTEYTWVDGDNQTYSKATNPNEVKLIICF